MSLEQELILCDRETGLQGSFLDFVKIAWPVVFANSPLVCNWHIPLICEHYEACFTGEIRELVVNLPPGGSKSSITSVLFPVWGWIRDPAASWIYAAYGQKLVRRDAQMSVDLIKSPWFQARWGDRVAMPTVPAVDLLKNLRSGDGTPGWRLGTTPGGEVTGFHANYQVIDDPNKPEELTKVGLGDVRDWEARTMSSRWRRPPATNSLILIMQRLHCDDLAQALIDRGAVHICLPANFDPSRRTVTSWGRDPRTQPNELLDAVRLPQTLIDQLRRNLGPINAAAQLDQAPVPEGGAVFKREWLRFWSDRRVGKFPIAAGWDPMEVVAKPPQLDQSIDSWDCAFKAEEDSDYVSGQTWSRVGANFYLMDSLYGHMDFPATVRGVLALRKRNRLATTTVIEDKANGSGVIQTLQSKVPGIVACDPKGGKFARASACAGFFEAGNVFLPDPAMPGYEWVGSFVQELLSFPRAKHDDQVDACTQALLYLQEHTSYLKAAMAAVRRMTGVPLP